MKSVGTLPFLSASLYLIGSSCTTLSYVPADICTYVLLMYSSGSVITSPSVPSTVSNPSSLFFTSGLLYGRRPNAGQKPATYPNNSGFERPM